MSMGYRSRRFMIQKMISFIWSVAVLFLAITGVLSIITGGNIWAALLLAIILIAIGWVVTYLGATMLSGVDAGG